MFGNDDRREEGRDDHREGHLGLIHEEPVRGAVDDRRSRRLLAPLRRPAVRRLLTATLVSRTGDWLTVGALMGWVYQETSSTATVAALMLVRLVPPILGGGAAAALVDGVRRERLLVVVELLRALALGTTVWGVVSGSTPLVYVAIAASGLLGAISPVAVSALVPRLVPATELPAVNGLMGVSESSAMAAGAVVGSLLLALVGIVPALVLDLGSFLLAALLFARVGAVEGAAPEAGEDDATPTAGLRDLLADRRVVTAVGAFCVTALAVGLANATLPRFLEDVGLGTGAYGYGFGAIATGLAIGGAISGTLRLEEAGTAVLGRTLLVSALLFAGLSVASSAPLALLLLVGVGVLDAIGWVVFDTVLQRTAAPEVLGRAFGLTEVAVKTAMTGSIALAPVVNGVAAPAVVLLGGAVLLVLGGLTAIAGCRDSAQRVGRREVEVPVV